METKEAGTVRKPRVFFALPLHDNRVECQTANTLIEALAGYPNRTTDVDTWVWFNSSALCLTFNSLWARFYERWRQGLADVFVMLHSDIEVTGHPYEDQGRPWVDFLVEKALEENMVCLSVANAIKNREGHTSVAMGHGEWSQRRISFADLELLPPTFDDTDFLRATGTTLLVNTGCMVLVPHDSWAHEFQFEFHDRIITSPEGHKIPQMAPEDWNMSRFFHNRNLCYGATREIETLHYGKIGFPNFDDGSGFYEQEGLLIPGVIDADTPSTKDGKSVRDAKALASQALAEFHECQDCDEKCDDCPTAEVATEFPDYAALNSTALVTPVDPPLDENPFSGKNVKKMPQFPVVVQ